MSSTHWTRAVAFLGSEAKLVSYLPKDGGVGGDEVETIDDHPTLEESFALAREELRSAVLQTPFELGDESETPDLPLLLDEHETAVALFYVTVGSDRQPEFLKEAYARAQLYLTAVAKGYKAIVGLVPTGAGGSAGIGTYVATTIAGRRWFDRSSSLSPLLIREPDL